MVFDVTGAVAADVYRECLRCLAAVECGAHVVGTLAHCCSTVDAFIVLLCCASEVQQMKECVCVCV